MVNRVGASILSDVNTELIPAYNRFIVNFCLYMCDYLCVFVNACVHMHGCACTGMCVCEHMCAVVSVLNAWEKFGSVSSPDG